MIKLAGVLFQENGLQEDILLSKEIINKAIELEPKNSEALLLQGKVYHKLGEWKNAITALQQGIQASVDDPN